MYHLIAKSGIPKFLKVLLIILLTLTCVYWIGLFIYKILEGLRIAIHFVSDKKVWWAFIIALILTLVIVILIIQFGVGIDIWGAITNYFVGIFDNCVNGISNIFNK